MAAKVLSSRLAPSTQSSKPFAPDPETSRRLISRTRVSAASILLGTEQRTVMTQHAAGLPFSLLDVVRGQIRVWFPAKRHAEPHFRLEMRGQPYAMTYVLFLHRIC